jgi:hypothetical protein
MGRDFSRNHLRSQIAHLAARLMAQDGIEDYALAKRKAARQAGAADVRQLPDNDEIDAALKLYRELYQQEHPAQLRGLRELALDVMDEFSQFDPHLSGSVLKGNAGKYAAIHLQLFTDNAKSVEHYLLNRGIEFRSDESRLYAGDMPVEAPVLSFDRDSVEIHMTVLSSREQRLQLKTSPQGKPLERARREAVAALLAAE